MSQALSEVVGNGPFQIHTECPERSFACEGCVAVWSSFSSGRPANAPSSLSGPTLPHPLAQRPLYFHARLTAARQPSAARRGATFPEARRGAGHSPLPPRIENHADCAEDRALPAGIQGGYERSIMPYDVIIA